MKKGGKEVTADLVEGFFSRFDMRLFSRRHCEPLKGNRRGLAMILGTDATKNLKNWELN